jgi:hypothetical protein
MESAVTLFPQPLSPTVRASLRMQYQRRHHQLLLRHPIPEKTKCSDCERQEDVTTYKTSKDFKPKKFFLAKSQRRKERNILSHSFSQRHYSNPRRLSIPVIFIAQKFSFI